MTAIVNMSGKGFVEALDHLGKQIEQWTEFVVQDTARYAKKHAQETRLFEDRTGTLRQATRAEFVPAQMRSFIINETKYAYWVEKGTKPHPIRARRVPNLYFWWERKQVWFEDFEVNHPGTKARPFFKAAGYLAEGFLQNRLGRHVRTQIVRFNDEGK